MATENLRELRRKFKESLLTQEMLKEDIFYDPEIGILTLVGTKKGRCIYLDKSTGYVRVDLNGFRYQAHRLAWLYVMGEWPEDEIDHINGVRGDNRWCNLRKSTAEQNKHNKSRCKKDGLKGTSFIPRLNLWRSQIQYKNENISLGCHKTAQQAHEAYCRKADELFGEFARYD